MHAVRLQVGLKLAPPLYEHTVPGGPVPTKRKPRSKKWSD